MHAELEDWNNGWHGLRLSLSSAEISRLVQLLQGLQEDPDQHFHISSDYAGAPGMGDIEISVAGPEEAHNMWLSGMAIAPGSDLPTAGA